MTEGYDGWAKMDGWNGSLKPEERDGLIKREGLDW